MPAARWALAAGCAAALALTACSSSGSSGSSKVSGGASTAAIVRTSSQLLATAAASAVTGPSSGIVPANQIVAWKPSLMPVPVALPQGKKVKVDVVYDIPAGFTPYSAHLIQAIGARLGWQVKVIQATAPTQPAALTAMQQAVLDKPNAIIGSVVPGVWVGPALAKAKSAGISTVDMHQDSTTGPGYSAWVPDAEGVQKALLAAYAVSTSKGTAHSLLVDAPGFSDANIPAATSYLKGCSSCSTKTTQFNPTDFTDPGKAQSDATAKLATTTNLDYLFWPDGALPIQGVVTAIGSSRNKNAKLLVNDAAPTSIQPLTAGQLPLVVQAPAALMALTAIDDVSRMMQGKAPLAEDALRFPVSYWTPKTSPKPNYSAITTKQLTASDWLTPFEKTWGVQLRSTVLGISS